LFFLFFDRLMLTDTELNSLRLIRDVGSEGGYL
jgi:hypothetical protein